MQAEKVSGIRAKSLSKGAGGEGHDPLDGGLDQQVGRREGKGQEPIGLISSTPLPGRGSVALHSWGEGYGHAALARKGAASRAAVKRS